MRRFDAVVFDFDGVLVDSVDVKTRAFAALYTQYGPEVVASVAAYHLAHSGISRFEKFRHFHRAFLGQALSAEQEAALGLRFAALVEDAVVSAPWVRGAGAFLRKHHRDLPLFVASGTPDEELKRIIERRNAGMYFAGVGGSPLTKAEIITAFVRGAGLDPGRVLMVGDSITDHEGAQGAGTRFLGIADNESTFPRSVHVLPDLTGLDDFLDALDPG